MADTQPQTQPVRTTAGTDATSLLQPTNYVGFDTITTQIENRMVKRGFTLNVMLVGASGLGKSTLINTLFSSHLDDSCGRNTVYEPIERTPDIKVTSHDMIENNVILHLNIIDTPGFADQINNNHCWDPLLKYVKDQHNQYLRRELNASREKFIKDTRVHCALYFVAPNYYGLSRLDVQALKKLTEVVNVVPVIAKSDTLTMEERANLKRTLQDQFKHYNLRMYPYNNQYDDRLTSEEIQFNKDIRSMLPFAVIGSEDVITTPKGETVRGRRTKWGTINVEDVTQCEFVYLRDFLTRTHLYDLIETTSLQHYEAFRTKQLTALRENVGARNSSQSQNQS
ncbi:cell division control protein [Brettanomyces nanus]|uniref:Cell division control protein 10 n=1 Tax=Eeniella nana TaxID=13502 RepID=A0A875S9L8_EENNA|nr:cell division control protein [Brettanomyces nanus]QPG75744.1 cell division control protein [Brettanomyces nanus]